MSGHFEVVFSGEIYAAVDPVKVRSDMARIFKQPPEKVHQLFDGRTWVLKDGLDRATAERYQVELAKIGVISEVRDKAPKYESSRAKDPNSKSQNFTLEKIAVAKMKCPDCQYEQLEADYCAKCGVSIAVAQAKAKVRAKEDEVIQARIRQLRERRGTGDDIDATVPEATAASVAPPPQRPAMVQETTAEFHGAPARSGPSPVVWVLGTLVLLGAVFGLLVQQGVIALNL